MDLMTFLASQPSEALSAGTKIQITRTDGTVTTLTLGERVLVGVEDDLLKFRIPVFVHGERPQIVTA